ncbi:MAG: hypothetical protein AAF570_18410, partial [Bacteroidota bacterium]
MPDLIIFNINGVAAGTNTGPVPDKLLSIRDGIGNHIALEYTSLSDTSVYASTNALVLGKSTLAPPLNAPIPHYKTKSILGGNSIVVSRLDLRNDPEINVMDYAHSYRFRYADAKMNLEGRGYEGVRTREKIDRQEGRTETLTLLQNFPFTGSIAKKTYTANTFSNDPKSRNGAKLSELAYAYEAKKPFPNTYQVNKTRSVQRFYDYGDYRFSLGTGKQYDRYGNCSIESTYNYTDSLGNDLNPGDNVYRLRDFINDARNLHFGMLRVSKMSASKDTNGLAAINNKTAPGFSEGKDFSLITYRYDRPGNVIEKSAWDNAKNNELWLTDKFTYDQLGNHLSHASPAGNRTRFVIEKDFHTYVDSTILPPDEKGRSLTIQSGYDPRFGKKVAEQDQNGHTHISVLDNFGRKSAVQGPLPDLKGVQKDPNLVSSYVTGTHDFSKDEVLTLKQTDYGHANGDSLYIETQVLQKWPTSETRAMQWHRVYFDGLGRHYREVSSGDCQSGKGNIVTDHRFDAAGKIVASSLPYFQGQAPLFSRHWFDVYNR